MKQVKIAFYECKKKIPHRPPDEIDFGLGFRAALKWFLSMREQELGDTLYDVEEELN
jgi:hypothetical protein